MMVLLSMSTVSSSVVPSSSFLLLLLLLWLFSSSAVLASAAEPILQCPTPGDVPQSLELTVASDNDQLSIELTSPDSLCTLTQRTTASANGDAPTIIPVSRSYNGYNWERVAGPYSSTLSVDQCANGACSLTIPKAGTYYLTSFVHELSSPKDQTARFLEISTFGPTDKTIEEFPSTNPFQDAAAEWISAQMDDKPMTLHRSYFRKRSNRRQQTTSVVGLQRGPCEIGGRWIRHSIIQEDRDSERMTLNVKALLGNNQYLLSINGRPRTVIDYRLKFETWDNDIRDHVTVAVQPGDYKIGDVEEQIGGRFVLEEYIDTSSNNKRYGWVRLEKGNPPMYLPQDIIDTNEISVMNLPSIDDGFTEQVATQRGMESGGSTGLVLGRALTDTANRAVCDTLPRVKVGELIGKFTATGDDGSQQQQAWYDPRLIIEDNTIENPLQDGGGSNVLSGSMCANVDRTFLNEDTCRLSESPVACGPMKAQAQIKLNENSLVRMHELTGRYVYAVNNLRLDKEKFGTLSPCVPNSHSRWKKVQDNTCTTAEAPPLRTVKLFRERISWSSDETNLVDIWMGSDRAGDCPVVQSTVGMKVLVEDDGEVSNPGCWKHVHPDLLGVYDMTYWTFPDTHPGNVAAADEGKPNPIKKVAGNGQAIVNFPSWHSMEWWDSSKERFEYAGRLGDTIKFEDLIPTLRYPKVAEEFGLTNSQNGVGVLVCGSPGEVESSPDAEEVFYLENEDNSKDGLETQKESVWTMVALTAEDQLRQKVAFILSGLLVITPNQIQSQLTESYLTYYDIFVRHAFGNYRDVLREVAYSPMMAEMLSFLDSKSTGFIWGEERTAVYPDENFAREIMQLFSIGTVMLNMDGTPIINITTGQTIPTYNNRDIMSFSRAWTAFTQRNARGNIELANWQPNRVDPMKIIPEWRDALPKKDLYGGYIGDKYPLCTDIARGSFLRKGATYRLLGNSPIPELLVDPLWWYEDNEELKRVDLDKQTSFLYQKLCNEDGGSCNFKNTVVLDETVACHGTECLVDNLRTVQVSENIFYEFVQPTCVELALFSNAMTIRKNWPGEAICGDPRLEVAGEACCDDNPWWSSATRFCEFSGERMAYQTAQERCQQQYSTCDWVWQNGDDTPDQACLLDHEHNWLWTNRRCTLRVKVDSEGSVSIVHDPDVAAVNSNREDDSPYSPHHSVDLKNINYFPVNWKNGFPKASSNCGGSNSCRVVNGNCLCDIAVTESPVFTSMPSAEDALSRLLVGSVPPDWLDAGLYPASPNDVSAGVSVYHTMTSGTFTIDTIFAVEFEGTTRYFRNLHSDVQIQNNNGNAFEFRNPPRFIGHAEPTRGAAAAETEAVLDHYFHHPNVPPFIAERIIKRIGGVSNPSPGMVERVATAFKAGVFEWRAIKFGKEEYGDLAATVAAILLDEEAQSITLDADPANGQMREPLLKVIHFMRAMEFQARSNAPEVRLEGLQSRIGQMAHAIPNVFSYFLPEYSPPGLRASALTSPEAQVMTSPKIMNTLNGLYALIQVGLMSCYEGFGVDTVWSNELCYRYNEQPVDEDLIQPWGSLSYAPVSDTAEVIVDELATLLTSGRLNIQTRQEIQAAYNQAGGGKAGLEIAQQLVVSSPEFHSTNIISYSGEQRPKMQKPQPSPEEYKAVIFLNLEGGADSHNMLVPHSNCDGKNLYNEYKSVRKDIALNLGELLPIDATTSMQACNTFGNHPNLKAIKKMYETGDLLWAANVGVMTEPVVKETWWDKTAEQIGLFAHNLMQREVQRVDVFDKAAGRGMVGRMMDVVKRLGKKTGTLSINGITDTLVRNDPVFTIDPSGVSTFNPIPWNTDIEDTVKKMNDATTSNSGLFAETWSRMLYQSLGENELLQEAMDPSTASLGTAFPKTGLGRQMEAVARLIKTKDVRGTDTDAFYVSLGGFDTHSNVKEDLAVLTLELDNAMEKFEMEMKKQNKWDNVVVVMVSEFARTLTPNSGQGSDHGWGGNYFVAGGSVKGGKILGKQPTNILEEGPLNIGRGRLIPTTSWDSIWNGIAQWLGITSNRDLDEVLPNRNKFANQLFTKSDLFTGGSASGPIQPSCAAPGSKCNKVTDCCNGGMKATCRNQSCVKCKRAGLKCRKTKQCCAGVCKLATPNSTRKTCVTCKKRGSKCSRKTRKKCCSGKCKRRKCT